MYYKIFEHISQKHNEFLELTNPLKHFFALSFGYMRVYNDYHYFKIMDNIECMQKFVTEVETSHIFCERNVTNYFDVDYNYTLWPKEPNCKAMQIYKNYSQWNGISVSKTAENYVDLYWFTSQIKREDAQKFFIRNKPLLYSFIKRFDDFKDSILFTNHLSNTELFKFKNGFDLYIPESKYLKDEAYSIDRFFKNEYPSARKNALKQFKVTRREYEVLSYLCMGFTYKSIAEKMNISIRTVNHHMDNIKDKTMVSSRNKLVELFYKNNS